MNLAKLLFSISIFRVTLVLAATARFGKSCQIDQKFIYDAFEVECKRERTGIYLDVICRNDNWTDLSDIKLDLAFVKDLGFSNCSLPETLNLVNAINALGVNGSSSIGFKNLRTAPNRKNFQGLSVSRVSFSSSNLTELPFDMLHGVSGMESLFITDSDIRLFPKNFFRQWTKDLHTLHLLMNNLERITRDDFAELDNVRDINIHGNKITEIEAGAFDHLSSLISLDLSHNLLRTLPSGIFRHLTVLERLHLSQNPLDELPGDLLTGIDHCRLSNFRMNVINGSLKTLPNGFFRNLHYLRDVQLQGNRLESLPSDLFTGTSELVNLNLRDNYLRTLPVGFLDSSTKLEKLDLARNQIAILPAKIFQELFYLDSLDISYNDLTTLTSDELMGLSTLTTLNASHNCLIKVDDDLCQSLRKVQVIDFSFNQLTFQATRNYLNIGPQSIFLFCTHLKEIHLSNNKATRIFHDYLDRKYIDLSNNHVSEFTAKDIEYMSTIGTIDLRSNRISKINLTELPSAVTRYTALGNKLDYRNLKIMLGDNPLHCDCHLIDFVRYWKSERNSRFRQFVKLIASDIGGSMKCASPVQLKTRDISSIYPEELHCPLKTDEPEDACSNTCVCHEYPAKQVLSIDCSARNLSQVPPIMRNPRGWSIELNMSHNHLRETPSLNNNSDLENIISLDLSSNAISTITKDVFSPSLVDLKLDHNELSRLDATVVEYLTSHSVVLRSITLHANQWICDCRARDFSSFVQKKAVAYELFEVECFGTNDKLYAITASELCNGLMVSIIMVSFAIAIIAIVVGSGLTLCCRYSQEIKVLSHTKHWYMQLFTSNNELDKHHDYCDAFVNFSPKTNEIVVELVDLESS